MYALPEHQEAMRHTSNQEATEQFRILLAEWPTVLCQLRSFARPELMRKRRAKIHHASPS